MTTVVKIGGNIIDSEKSLRKFCSDFASLGGRKILVHGGGVMASQLQRRLGEEPVMVEGRRVTDENALRAVTMTYAGWCNKHIVALLQACGCNAIGLAGCDASLITASRRPPVALSDGSGTLDYGFVGDVRKDSIDTATLLGLLGMGLVPVFCAINHDGQGNLLNTNADTVACAISCAINAKLLYCFEKNGVLYDRFDEESVIPELDTRLYARLCAEGRIADGMIPKLDNAFKALGEGAAEVRIMHAGNLLSESGTRLAL